MWFHCNRVAVRLVMGPKHRTNQHHRKGRSCAAIDAGGKTITKCAKLRDSVVIGQQNLERQLQSPPKLRHPAVPSTLLCLRRER